MSVEIKRGRGRPPKSSLPKKPPPDALSGLEESAKIELARRNLTDFAPYVFGLSAYRHHRDWARAVESPILPRPHVQIISCPGSSKSTWLSQIYPLHRIGLDPSIHIILISNTAKQAEKFSVANRDVIDMSEAYRRVFPGVEPDRDKGWARDAWFVKRPDIADKNPTFISTGVFGPILGARADLIILDDIMDEEIANSEVLRDKLRNWVLRTVMSRLSPGGRLVSILTRWHDQDIAATFMADRRFKTIHMPALEYYNPGESIWPEYLSTESILLEKELNPISFETMWMGNPHVQEGQILKRSWWQWIEPSSLPESFDLVFQVWDTAFKKKEENDFCVSGETKVITSKGVLPIRNIRTGDMVLTHRGRFRRVSQITHRTVNNVRRLKAKSLDSVFITESHRTRAIRVSELKNSNRSVSPTEWVAVRDLVAIKHLPDLRRRSGGRTNRIISRAAFDAMTLPVLRPDTECSKLDLLSIMERVCKTEDRICTVKSGECEELRLAGTRAKPIPRYIRLTERFGYLCGLYLAEGSVNGHQVTWNFGYRESNLVALTRRAILSIFGIRAGKWEGGSTMRTIAGSRLLVYLFREFGHTSHTKHVPIWAMCAPADFQRGIVAGWLAGDGCIARGRSQIAIGSTVSESLAWQIRLMLTRFQVSASLGARLAGESSIGGRRIVPTGLAFRVSWTPEPKRRTLARMTLDRQTDKCAAYAVVENELVRMRTGVYNLRVDEDESYVTTAGTLHNCDCLTLARRSGIIYILNDYHEKLSWPELLDESKSQYLSVQPSRPQIVLVEDSASGQSLIQSLQVLSTPMIPVMASPRGDRDEISFASPIAGFLKSGRIFLIKGTTWAQPFVEEMSSWPKGAHNDRVMALAHAVQYLLQNSAGEFTPDLVVTVPRPVDMSLGPGLESTSRMGESLGGLFGDGGGFETQF